MRDIEFVAIDFETANPDFASVCQIGLAHFKAGCLEAEWKTYINPEDYFDGLNVSIHGIDEKTVKHAPTFKKISDHLFSYLDDHITVCHTHFDRAVARQACSKYNLRYPQCTWLDTARVTRRTWEECAYRGYGLKNVCAIIGYEFLHHDALEDAKASAHILLTAIEKTGLDIQGWIKRVEQPIDPSRKIAQDGNPEGVYYGETLVFTGSLNVSRSVAAEMAAKVGFKVNTGVNKETTVLVVGDQDIKKLAGHEKSLKHRKAEDLIKKGQNIRIVQESDFEILVNIES